MCLEVSQLIRSAILAVILFVMVSARPSHLEDSNQIQDKNEIPYPPLPWELLFQRSLAKLHGDNMIENGWPWDPELRNPEIKRQSRYRQCYFNPISCFRK